MAMTAGDSDTTVEFVSTGGLRQDRRSQPPHSMQVAVDLGAATHAGLVRPNNEDSYLVSRAERSLETLLTNLPAGSVPTTAAEQSYGLAVADGMGGQAAGEVASRVALQTVVAHVIATSDWIMRDVAENQERIEGRMSERFEAANQAVHEEAQQHPRWNGMGTTLTLAVSCGAQLFLGHVGDSRAYLLRSGQLQVLTRDHSYAQVLADSGQISQEQVATHRLRNVLLRHLGGSATEIDVRHLRLESGDQLLLCSDGLSDAVTGEAIAQILSAATRAQAACDALIEAALAAGGRDNITVLIARYSWKD
jgi:serine/threonine protein phosphatase PrpC